MARLRPSLVWLISAAALLTGCFQPVGPRNCLDAGTCECMKQSDCDAGKDCIDGKCVVVPPYVPPDERGKPCDAGTDCLSGLCLGPGPRGVSLCSVRCSPTGTCPGDWECKGGPNGVCTPRTPSLCLACLTDSECNIAGDRCQAGRCAKDCSFSSCPAGYACRGSDAGAQCAPVDSCDCTADREGFEVGCSLANDAGLCFGTRRCGNDGFFARCSARVPAGEVCNGLDDDCDGLVDGADSTLDGGTLTQNPFCTTGDAGVCTGTWACQDGGWACTAKTPVAEQCNGLDDDCNGRVDESFLDSSGRYNDLRHCGACGFDCNAALPNSEDGGVACILRSGAMACVPTRCAPGFYPYPETNPVGCRPLNDTSCRACANDLDCTTSWDRCVTLAGDAVASCLQSCEAGSPYRCSGATGVQGCCPAGQTCTATAGTKLCVPSTGTCACNASRLGATRTCFVGAAPQTCVGLETCQAGGAWSTCSTAVSTAELCDGLDNDCDNQVDENFIGTQGSSTYDTDAHCGACTTNCLARWSPTLQHAVGGCDAGPGVAPFCRIVRCTSEAVAAGADCRSDGECPAGQVCDPRFHTCARACGTDADCSGGRCVGGRCAAACASNAQCATPAVCGDAGACVRDWQFVDTDQDDTNGCECPSQPGLDAPESFSAYPDAGLAYLDRDCDGVDGVAATSLFVRANSSQSLGTRANPYRTINEALAAFNPNLHSAILVATGSYVERVVLTNGVKLYGGYSADFTRRDLAAYSTILEGPEPPFETSGYRPGTVHAANITAATVFSGFTVRGYDVTFRPDAGQPGKSSYAVYISNSGAALRLVNNRIVAGRGGEGATGISGAAGTNGGAGARGLDSRECLTTDCLGERSLGGAGGSNAACPAGNGTVGAPSEPIFGGQAYQPPLGLNGRGGANNQYGGQTDAGTCKPLCFIFGDSNGQPASNGPDGVAQAPGVGCSSNGGIVGGEWIGGLGGDGTTGSSATPGGGGGAGGWAQNTTGSTCSGTPHVGDLGATGGGGGAAGCPGTGGIHGGSGGASFGVFIFSSTGALPTIEGNFIEPGYGGAGGNGGPGGFGGIGGQGGEAGVRVWPAWCGGSAGRGGRGGTGGAGSGGGGGCGGAAYGLGGTGITGAAYDARNTFGPVPVGAGGSPGAGGRSPSAGADGLAGTAGQSGVWSNF